MLEIELQKTDGLIPFIEEKGDLEHAIRCAEQAEQRADSSWLKQACAFRVKMLRIQLARQRSNLK